MRCHIPSMHAFITFCCVYLADYKQGKLFEIASQCGECMCKRHVATGLQILER